MPVSADIYSQIQRPQPVNQLANMAQALQLQGAVRENQLGNMKLQEFEQGNLRRNRLAELAGQYGDKPEVLETEMRRGGYFDEAANLGKSRRDNMKVDADVGKTGAETEKIKLATAREKLSLAAQLLSTARDQASYDAARATAQANGLDVSRMPPQFDPQFVQSKLQESQSVADQLEQMWKQKGYDLDLRKQGEVERNNQTQNRISQGNLNVAQGNLGLSKQRLDLEKQNAGAGKAPPGYRFKPDGSLEAIPGGPADIKAGELGAKRSAQQQAAIVQADRIMGKVDQALSKVGMNTAGFGGSLMAKVPGTDARNLQSDMETIKANLGFAELQAMRDASPTGGALGQVAVQELIALQSTIASLDQAQGPAQLKERLGEVKKHYQNWKNVMQQASSGGAGGATGSWDSAPAAPLPQGWSVKVK